MAASDIVDVQSEIKLRVEIYQGSTTYSELRLLTEIMRLGMWIELCPFGIFDQTTR